MSEKITFEQYLEAELTVATVKATAWWQANLAEGKPVERPATESDWLDFIAVLKHTKFGETKFRELMREQAMPSGRDVGGKLMWHRPEVDRAMLKLFKAGKRNGVDQ